MLTRIRGAPGTRSTGAPLLTTLHRSAHVANRPRGLATAACANPSLGLGLGRPHGRPAHPRLSHPAPASASGPCRVRCQSVTTAAVSSAETRSAPPVPPVSPVPPTPVPPTVATPPAAPRDTLALPSAARFNEIGVQGLSQHLYQQVFPNGDASNRPSAELVKLAERHLERQKLLGKTTDTSAPIAFDLPPLVRPNATLDEHFHKLGVDAAGPYLQHAKKFAWSSIPPKPRHWVRRSGWTEYLEDGTTRAVDAPEGPMLVFDTEVLWKESPFAIMACAATPTAWYAWLSPWLLRETDNDRQLVPLGNPAAPRVIVGHNVGYDRARILEEYSLELTANAFLDTMSLHVAVNGMCSQQRPTWMKHKKNRELRDKIAKETTSVELTELLNNEAFAAEEEELWIERSSINSLRDVAKFHLNLSMDKEVRDAFGVLDRDGVVAKLDDLLTYCAADVSVTHRVFQIVFPNFLDVCPHPVSFAALRHLSSVILPVNKSWDAYVTNADAIYRKLSGAVQERLVSLADKALDIKDEPEKYVNDPWMKQLDWSGQEIKMTKETKKKPSRPVARQKMPGKPMWYKSLFPKVDGPINLTVRTRVSALLLRLSWDGYPLFWSDRYGWTFRVPRGELAKYTDRNVKPCDFADSEEGQDLALRQDAKYCYFKLPHKDGPSARCVNPMAKSYVAYFEKGVLSSEFSYAKEALEMNASCSYWISARERIKSQLVVYEDDLPTRPENSKLDRTGGGHGAADDTATKGFILPQVITMGTITRRAVENTWLTASNAKKNRVGSELKAMIRAPPGYVVVGADVDSEELWIASVIGDATFKLHGGNAIGFMTLEGTKAAGTDLHSRTAGILGITRNDAKVFNYGRIYGAGVKFASQLLRQFNPSLSEEETAEMATKLYNATKGTKTNRKSLFPDGAFWRGGSESFVFNKLEEFAKQDRPRTPVLGAGITEALMQCFISKNGYLTSRINWVIQSSGVDYLHLLIVAMDHLIRRYRIDARLAITVHDEIRYLVRREDRYRAATALQVANLWTRAMFAQQVGIDDLPQSCAFFSSVDIDHVLRKEVDMDCVTPSNPDPIPHGESIDLPELLARGAEARLDRRSVEGQGLGKGGEEGDIPVEKTAAWRPLGNFDEIEYKPRRPVMAELNESSSAADEAAASRGGRVGPAPVNRDVTDLLRIRAQIAETDAELRGVIRDQRILASPISAPSGSSGSNKYGSRKSTSSSKKGVSEPWVAGKGPGARKGPMAPYHASPALVPTQQEPLGQTGAYYQQHHWDWCRPKDGRLSGAGGGRKTASGRI